jgi:ACS family tartrate transporter-like MFS transporter
MFIIRGLLACLLGIVVLRMLADTPRETGWLSADERDALDGMLAREGAGKKSTHAFLPALNDPRVYLPSLIAFSFTLGS